MRAYTVMICASDYYISQMSNSNAIKVKMKKPKRCLSQMETNSSVIQGSVASKISGIARYSCHV